MTTQFRSRIKTVINYDGSDAATGGCCLPNGTKLTGDTITLSECNNQNGFFRAGDPDLLQCPDRGLTGCCCSCSYIRSQDGDFDSFLEDIFGDGSNYYGTVSSGSNLNEKGIRDNVTQCECNNLEGKWFYGKCNEIGTIESLCGSVNNETPNDTRVPAACCHGNTLTNELNCSNVCTSKECSDFSSDDYPYTSYFGDEVGGSGNLCEQTNGTIGSVNCTVDSISPRQKLFDEPVDESFADLIAQTQTRQIPCLEILTQGNNITHTCSMKTPPECFQANGFQYSQGNNKILRCSDAVVYAPTRGIGSARITPPSTLESNMPTIGDVFQGGIFTGIFEPGKSTMSRQKQGNYEIEVSRKEGNGTNERKWGLIWSLRPFGPYTEKNDNARYKYRANKNSEPILEVPTSFYDGFFNTHGNGTNYFGYNSELFENVRSLVYNGFNDWYIPSIDELSFIYKNRLDVLKLSGYTEGHLQANSDNYFAPLLFKLFYSNTMSSTLWSSNDKLGQVSVDGAGQIYQRKGYIYAQNMHYGTYYKTDRRTELVVPLVRRIYLD